MKRQSSGSVTLETAIFLPVMMLLIVGMIQFGKITYTYYALRNTVYTAARYLSVQRNTNFCDPADPNIVAAVNFAVTGTTDGTGVPLITNLTPDMLQVSTECIVNGAEAPATPAAAALAPAWQPAPTTSPSPSPTATWSPRASPSPHSLRSCSRPAPWCPSEVPIEATLRVSTSPLQALLPGPVRRRVRPPLRRRHPAPHLHHHLRRRDALDLAQRRGLHPRRRALRRHPLLDGQWQQRPRLHAEQRACHDRPERSFSPAASPASRCTTTPRTRSPERSRHSPAAAPIAAPPAFRT